ncbi:Holliday junction resolvase RuvX [Porticoccaceae bacterium LTM1]|nr:Holliday junction resolvase RuvX [Porticoccaceae bacterium LTM1]
MTTTVKTLLAFDYGTRSIGVATGQTVTGSANALTELRARDGVPNWDEIEKLLKEWQPQLVLVGLPLNMDDTESEFAARARKFAKRLHGRFGVQVAMVDERLSTREAKALAGQRDSYRENPVDAIAAQLILESWLTDNSIGKPA